MAATYHPPARARPSTWLATLGAAGAAAGGAGVVGHLAGRVAALVLALPALEGLAVGLAVAAAMRRTAPLSPRAAWFATAAWAAAAFALHLGLDRALLRSRAAAAAERARATFGVAGAIPERPLPPSWGRAASARYGDALPPTAAAALLAAELSLAARAGGALARAAARDPACPVCGAWRRATPLGRAAAGAGPALVAELTEGRQPAALPPPDTREALLVSVARCPHGHDGDGGAIELGELRVDARRRLRVSRLALLEASTHEIDGLARRLATRAEPGV